jgi:ribonuclease P protein component
MIARIHRFHGHASLPALYRRSKSVRSDSMNLRYAQRSRQPSYRLAVVVSRKVSKSAVVRNRIRRRIYEIVRLHAAEQLAVYDMVLTIYADGVATISSAELESQVVGLLIKAGIISTDKRAIVNLTGK